MTPTLPEADVERVARAIVEEIGWGTFSHFDPEDVRRIARAALSASPLAGRVEELTEALREIKLLALTCGAPGRLNTAAALTRMIRLCIDAGITEKLDALDAARTLAGESPHD